MVTTINRETIRGYGEDYTIEQNEEFLRLAKSITKRWLGLVDNNHYTLQDIYSEALYGITKALETYDTSKGVRFTTYAYKHMNTELYRLYQLKNTKSRRDKSKELPIDRPYHHNGMDLSFHDLFSTQETSETLHIEVEERKYIHTLLERLSPDDRYLICSLLGIKGYSKKLKKDIAQDLQLTRYLFDKRFEAIQEELQYMIMQDDFIDYQSFL